MAKVPPFHTSSLEYAPTSRERKRKQAARGELVGRGAATRASGAEHVAGLERLRRDELRRPLDVVTEALQRRPCFAVVNADRPPRVSHDSCSRRKTSPA